MARKPAASRFNGQCDISINRMHSHDGEQITIQLIDRNSSIAFVTVEMTLEKFASAITGMYVSENPVEYAGLHLVGLKHEVKTELVPLTYSDAAGTIKKFDFRNDDTHYAKALEAFEKNGWVADRGNLTNHHCHVTGKNDRDHANVNFHRHVKP